MSVCVGSAMTVISVVVVVNVISVVIAVSVMSVGHIRSARRVV